MTDVMSQPEHCSAMAFDEARGVAVCFHGESTSETWTFDGSMWTMVATTGPSPRSTQMIYDAARDRIVLVPSDIYSGAYEFDGSVWTKVDPAIAPSLGL